MAVRWLHMEKMAFDRLMKQDKVGEQANAGCRVAWRVRVLEMSMNKREAAAGSRRRDTEGHIES